MARQHFNIDAGDRVVIEGRVHILDCMVPNDNGSLHDDDDFQFRDPRTNRVQNYTLPEFLEVYAAGKVRLLSPTERVSDRLPQQTGLGDKEDLGAGRAIEKARRRLAYLQAYDRTPVAKSTRSLREFIEEQARRQDDLQPPSPGALRRWIVQRGIPDHRRLHEMVGRQHKGPRGKRLVPDVERMLEDEAERYWSDIAVTPSEIWHRIAYRVREENERLGHAALSRPALSTVCHRLRQLVTFERACRRWGHREASRQFGMVRGSMRAEAILDLAIIDHTVLDCWVIDDKSGQPIGRPTLTILLDSCSRYPLGFHVGWEGASLASVMACLRHAVMPKLYMKERYPDLKRPWLAYGQPRTILVDQGVEFMGSTFEDACATLGIAIEVAPVRTPEFKGQIERLFGTANRGLFHKLPGGVQFKASVMRELGIDPEKTAVLTLSELNELIHRWVVDIYANTKNRMLGAAPAQVWLERSKTDTIEIARDPAVLNQACAHVVFRSLSKEGVGIHNLHYRSEALKDLRLRLHQKSSRANRKSASMPVKVSYDPANLERIFVWDPIERCYVEARSTRPDYTRGLALNVHEMVRGWAAKADREFETEADMTSARAAFYDRIDELRASRVVDRKRVQRVRHPERVAKGDVVVRRLVTGAGEARGTAENEVLIDTAGNRADGDRKEPRSPLGGPRKSSKRTPTARAEEVLPASKPTSLFGTVDWSAQLRAARQNSEAKA